MAGLQRAAEGSTTFPDYALLIADTVAVRDGAPAELLTGACPSAWAEVAYYFKASPAAGPWPRRLGCSMHMSIVIYLQLPDCTERCEQQ